MRLGRFSTIFLLLIIIAGVVMTSGCTSGTNSGDAEQEEYYAEHGYKMCETTSSYEPYNFTTNQWITSGKNTQNQQSNQDTSQDTQTTTKKSTQTTQTSTSSKTTATTPSKPASCSHPSITTKYVGLDKATGKVIYDTYCSKCGEYMGRTLY